MTQVVKTLDVVCGSYQANWAIDSEFQRETDKAVFTQVYYTAPNCPAYNKAVWIPKSILAINKDTNVAYLPMWFVDKNFAPIAN